MKIKLKNCRQKVQKQVIYSTTNVIKYSLNMNVVMIAKFSSTVIQDKKGCGRAASDFFQLKRSISSRQAIYLFTSRSYNKDFIIMLINNNNY